MTAISQDRKIPKQAVSLFAYSPGCQHSDEREIVQQPVAQFMNGRSSNVMEMPITKSLPQELQGSLLTVAEIDAELAEDVESLDGEQRG